MWIQIDRTEISSQRNRNFRNKTSQWLAIPEHILAILFAYIASSDFASTETNAEKNMFEKYVKIVNVIKVTAEDVTQKNANISSSTKDVNSMKFVPFPMFLHSIQY